MLAGVLVTGAGLLVRSATALYTQGPGFDYAGRLVFEVRPGGALLRGMLRSEGVSEEGAQKAMADANDAYWAVKNAFREAVVHRVASLPGVVGVTATSRTPLSGSYWFTPFVLDANERSGAGAPTEGLITSVEPNYFDEMRIPILQGRRFSHDDRAVTFAWATLTLIVAAALAAYLPARRAAMVDPLTALRHD